MEMEKTFETLREIIKQEMDDILARGEMDENTLCCIYKMVDILKDLGEIEMSEEGFSNMYMPPYAFESSMNSYDGYNREGMSMADGRSMRGRRSYSRGNRSYRGGRSYRGYSRDGYSNEGNTMEKLQRLMDEASNDREREAIQKAMQSM